MDVAGMAEIIMNTLTGHLSFDTLMATRLGSSTI
jgi:hypothetical protein